MALDRGHDLDWFSSPMIIALVVVAAVGFVAFLIWELTDDHPIVNLRVFSNRGFAVGSLITSMGFAVFFGAAILSPLWLQTGMGYTQTWASRTAILTAMVGVAQGPMVAWLLYRYDPRLLVTFGTLAMAAAYSWRASFNADVTFEIVVVSQILIGMGMSFVFGPAMTLAFRSIEPHELANAAGMTAFVRTASMAFSAALTTTHWQDGMTINRAGIVDRLGPHPGAATFDAAGISAQHVPWQLEKLVEDQAVMLATNDTYFMFAAMVAVGAVVVWLAPNRKLKPKAA
jgi:DHA2 family multidrug resistance protein